MARVVPLALATLAGLAAWLSLGVLAVVDRASGARVGILPPWWMLAALVGLLALAVVVRKWPTSRLMPLALTILPCLPWLPGRLPPAFLIWYGPPATLVWGLVVLGLVAPTLARVGTWRAVRSPERAPWLAAAAALSCYAAGAVALQPRLPAGDEPHYLVITQSLLTDGDARIENNHARGEYYPYFSGELRPDYLQRGQDGQIYSVHAPGLSVLLAPAFAAGGYPASVVALMVLAAWGVALLWITVWHLTASASAAWVAAAGWALSAPAYFHAFAIYPDGAGAVGTIVGLCLLVRLDRGPAVGAGWLVTTGAVLAALPWLHTRFALISGVMGLALAARLLARVDRLRAVGLLMAIPTLSAAAWFGYFWMVWGTPSPAAPYGHYTQSAWSNLAPGLPGLLVDQQFGLLANAPLYALAIVGMVPLARRHPRLALEITVLLVPYLLAVASYRMWWAGLSAPARFLVAVLPAAALPLGLLWSRANTGLRAVALVLLALNIAMIVPRVVVDQGVLLYNARDGFDLLLDWANRSVNLPLGWPSLHRDAPLDALADTAVWVTIAALLAGAATWLSARVGSAWTLACGSIAVTVMTSASLVWARHDQSPTTPTTSALDLLQREPSPWPGAIGWQSRPPRFLPAADVPGRLSLASATRGPAAAGSLPLFSAPLVPAGRYELVMAGSRPPEGRLTVTVGRSEQTVDSVETGQRPNVADAVVLDLPVRVRSLVIDGDARARETAGPIVLRPRVVNDRLVRVPGVARRGARYGDVRVFFLDDNAYMEPSGFWTLAGSATTVVVDHGRPGTTAPASALVLSIRAGGVPTTATLSIGAWTQAVSLGAGETRAVTLPPLDGGAAAWHLRIDSGTGFRPGEHEPGSRDFRNLGVWVSVP